MLSLEAVPFSFKHGVITHVYKGSGKDPLLFNSYRGITICSNLTNVFEIILLERRKPILEERGIPVPEQTAYKKGVSCDDAIFTMVEALKRYRNSGVHLYLCTYDLEKAFDIVEYSTTLINAGINEKVWWPTSKECPNI